MTLRRQLSTAYNRSASASVPVYDTWWSDVCAPYEHLRLQSSEDGCTVTRSHPLTPAAALAGPALLSEGAHEITYSIRGCSAIIGVAEAEEMPSEWPWKRKAWGLAMWNRQLVSCPTMLETPVQSPSLEPATGAEVTPVTVRMRIDTIRRRVNFIHSGKQLGALPCAGAAFRPWVLFAPREGDERDGAIPIDSVRLVSHKYRLVPTWNVEGLTEAVNELPPPKQSLALAWCEARGVGHVGQLGRDSARLVSALKLPHDDARALSRRLEQDAPRR